MLNTIIGVDARHSSEHNFFWSKYVDFFLEKICSKPFYLVILAIVGVAIFRKYYVGTVCKLWRVGQAFITRRSAKTANILVWLWSST